MKELMPMMRADLSCGLGLRFWLAVALVPFLIVADNFVDMMGMYSPSVFYMHYGSFASGGLYGTYLVYMLCALPYAGAFWAEYSGNMAGSVMARCGKRTYFLSKMFAACLLGGMVALLGHALTLALLRWGTGLDWISPGDWDQCAVLRPLTLGYFPLALYYAFGDGVLSACVAVGASPYVRNHYGVLVAPAIFQFCSIQVHRLLRIPIEWQPIQWMRMRSLFLNIPATMLMSLGAVAAVVALASWLFIRGGKKVMGCE